jgi:hypothetical protein
MQRAHNDSLIPKILDKLLLRLNLPNLEEHVDRLGPQQWTTTPAFTSVAQLLTIYETNKDHWHHAAIVQSPKKNMTGRQRKIFFFVTKQQQWN